MQIAAPQQSACRDIPSVQTAVDTNSQGFAVSGSGKAQLSVTGPEETNIAKTERFVVFAQLA